MQELRAEIAAQLRDRLAESRGAETSLRQLRESVLDADFLSASPAELAAMRATVQPLARRLAATARRRRRPNRSGKLDVRRTMRRAIATGGVPIDPAWRRRRRPRPRLLVLCDVSGSVAEFAKFTLSLLHALHAELPRLRSFVFADGVAEVTDLVRVEPGGDRHPAAARPAGGGARRRAQRLRRRAAPVHRPAAGGVARDCVVIVCGDARGNYRPERGDLLRALRGRVRAVHWLNPELRRGLGHRRFPGGRVPALLRLGHRGPQPAPAQHLGRQDGCSSWPHRSSPGTSSKRLAARRRDALDKAGAGQPAEQARGWPTVASAVTMSCPRPSAAPRIMTTGTLAARRWRSGAGMPPSSIKIPSTLSGSASSLRASGLPRPST